MHTLDGPASLAPLTVTQDQRPGQSASLAQPDSQSPPTQD
jgi:hypothetical protein